MLVVGCSSQSDPAVPSPPTVPAPSPETESDPPATEAAPEVNDATTPDSPAAVMPNEPSPPKQDPPPQAAEPPPTPAVVDIGGPVEVGATKPGLSRIGAAKCKICHKVQFASWTETAHATRTPPLDCEDCHGPGSEYKSKKVMEDPEKARSAGLVTPDRSFCSQCHTADWTDDLLERTHAHKVEDS
jgi:hypothetical protein